MFQRTSSIRKYFGSSCLDAPEPGTQGQAEAWRARDRRGKGAKGLAREQEQDGGAIAATLEAPKREIEAGSGRLQDRLVPGSS